MMEREKGRPQNAAGRLEKEIRCYDFLDEQGISYERVDHEPADTMEICAEIEKVLGSRICKNLFLCNRQQTSFYLLLMPGEKPFRTKDLSAQIGSSRLSFAPPEAMERYLHTAPGSASLLGLLYDREHRVQLLVDADLLGEERLGCHPCINTSSVSVSMQDVREKILPVLGYVPDIVTL